MSVFFLFLTKPCLPFNFGCLIPSWADFHLCVASSHIFAGEFEIKGLTRLPSVILRKIKSKQNTIKVIICLRSSPIKSSYQIQLLVTLKVQT